MAKVNKETVRCAVYCRKSVEDGLEQEFNSLDAQREAGENYIASQKGNGWVCLPQHYDDGGFSGGNTNRPALQQLLADIKDGKIDNKFTVIGNRVDLFESAVARTHSCCQNYKCHNFLLYATFRRIIIHLIIQHTHLFVKRVLTYLTFSLHFRALRTRQTDLLCLTKGACHSKIHIANTRSRFHEQIYKIPDFILRYGAFYMRSPLV